MVFCFVLSVQCQRIWKSWYKGATGLGPPGIVKPWFGRRFSGRFAVLSVVVWGVLTLRNMRYQHIPFIYPSITALPQGRQPVPHLSPLSVCCIKASQGYFLNHSLPPSRFPSDAHREGGGACCVVLCKQHVYNNKSLVLRRGCSFRLPEGRWVRPQS